MKTIANYIIFFALCLSLLSLPGCGNNSGVASTSTNDIFHSFESEKVTDRIAHASTTNTTVTSMTETTATTMTGFPDGEVQIPCLFINNQLYSLVPGQANKREKNDQNWILIGTVTNENNLHLPQENGAAARISPGSEIFQEASKNILWVRLSDGWYWKFIPDSEQ